MTPWLFLYQPLPKLYVPTQLPTPPPTPIVAWVHIVWVGVGIKKAMGQ